MPSPLRREVSAWLAKVGIARPPLFANDMQASAFDAANRVGSWRVLPRTDSRFAVIDERRPVGDRTVEVYDNSAAAHAALERLAAGAKAAA